MLSNKATVPRLPPGHEPIVPGRDMSRPTNRVRAGPRQAGHARETRRPKSKNMKLIIYELLSAIIPSTAGVAAAQPRYDVDMLIKSYSQAIKRYERLALVSESRTYVNSVFDDDGRIPSDHLILTDTFEYW